MTTKADWDFRSAYLIEQAARLRREADDLETKAKRLRVRADEWEAAAQRYSGILPTDHFD